MKNAMNFRKVNRFFVTILLLLVMTISAPMSVYAASNATKKISYTPLYSDCIIKSLVMYATDSFTVTYNKKTGAIVSVKPSQTTKTLGTDMTQKGGIKLISKSSKSWTYRSTWYLNLNTLPKWAITVASKLGVNFAKYGRLGRICTLTINYTVSANNLKHTQTANFYLPQGLKSKLSAIKKFVGMK